MATVRSRMKPPIVTVVGALAWPAASVVMKDKVSPLRAVIVAVKLPSAVAVTVAIWPVRVLVIVTWAPPATLPIAPMIVTCPFVTGPTVREA